MAKNLFNSILAFKPKRNVFDLTHDVKLSCKMGQLVPIMCTEAVPGDKFTISCESLLRFAPLIAPVMHRFNVTMHYFFVPWRILWPNFEDYITNGAADPNEAGDLPAFPTITVGNDIGQHEYTRLMDYLGLPDADYANNPQVISALPFAAYNKIFDEYYRDQNVVDPVFTPCINGAQTPLFRTQLLHRAWMHDYFTSALPFAQKGAAVDIPLGEVQYNNPNDVTGLFRTPGGALEGGDVTQDAVEQQVEINGEGVAYDPRGTLEVEPTTINDLRRAFRLQEWLEKNARGGSRYIENILMHFGVKSSDKRLQRPEYITGIKSPVTISEIVNTTGEVDGLPQGNMAGHGVGVTSGRYGKYFCEEHGYIMGIMSVMPMTAYQQGIPKHFIKTEHPTQLYWPSFANIGEQEILRKEVYADSTDPEDTFGYVPRYAEYKFENNRVAGDFRSTLNFWHAGRIFETEPQLNEDFIVSDPTDRIFAVQDETDNLWVNVLNKVKAVRPMPKFGTPMF